MKFPALTALAAIVLAGLVGPCAGAVAGEIRILSSNGLKEVLGDLAPEFERATGHKVVAVFDSAAAVKRKVEAGDTPDIAIATPVMIDDLIRQGRIAAGTRVEVARSGLGVAIRAGAAKPDIGTAESFKQTLLNAKSLTYNKEGQSGLYMAALVERLGIGEQIKGKTRLKLVSGPVAEDVAKGEAELGFQLISEILPVRGAELLGPLPPDLQTYVVLATGIGSGAKEAEAARDFIKFLATPSSAQIMKVKGMESLAR